MRVGNLHPAISSVLVLMANLQLVATYSNKVPHSFQELVVIRCTEKIKRRVIKILLK